MGLYLRQVIQKCKAMGNVASMPFFGVWMERSCGAGGGRQAFPTNWPLFYGACTLTIFHTLLQHFKGSSTPSHAMSGHISLRLALVMLLICQSLGQMTWSETPQPDWTLPDWTDAEDVTSSSTFSRETNVMRTLHDIEAVVKENKKILTNILAKVPQLKRKNGKCLTYIFKIVLLVLVLSFCTKQFLGLFSEWRESHVMSSLILFRPLIAFTNAHDALFRYITHYLFIMSWNIMKIWVLTTKVLFNLTHTPSTSTFLW